MKKIFYVLLFLIIILSSCSINDAEIEEKNMQEFGEHKIVATWISYYEINNLVTSVNSQNEFETLIKDIVDNLKIFKINTIFLQVRAFDDCFYNSAIYSVSKYCLDDNNKLKFDVLQTFIKICKKQNVDVHAWINPYRISNDNDINSLNSKSYAAKILNQKTDDERIIVTKNNIYYNPAYPDVQNYILDGVREIIVNYKVDGIHIDDYFYPTTSENIDKQIYENYIAEGGSLSLSDFRRNCINSLISSMYQVIKNHDSNLIFSISPCADIEKNYNNYYADVKLWASNKGFADYIIPQLYYGFNHTTMPFESLLSEWTQLKNSNNKIIIGLALYKVGAVDEYAGDGMYEWKENCDVISRQMKVIENYLNDGISLYSSSFLFNSKTNDNLEIERESIIDYINNW